MNEAFAKEVERNVQRREEIESTAGKLAAPQESKDMPTPPDSDPRKRHAMKVATGAARSSSTQMEGNRAVADESRMDVEEKFERRKHQTTNSDENINGGITNG